MNRRINILFSSLVVVTLMVSTVFAGDVLLPGSNSPKQVVLLRQFVMQAMNGDVSDLLNKVKADDIKGVSANARSLAALASFLPLLYGETHQNEYPIPAKKYFFKGAPIAEIETLSQDLVTQAKELIKLSNSNDMAAVKAHVPKLRGSCTACHKVSRGEYK